MSRPLRDKAGWLAILGGATLAFAVQVLAPVGVPLYDGVAVQEPYRFLHPTGDQRGSPGSFTLAPAVANGKSPEIQAYTPESPPQVQLILLEDALVLTPGATAVKVSITPVEPPAAEPGGRLVGNVYRLSVTDQSGAPLSLRTCDGCASLVLRAPDGTGEARLQRFAGGTWSEIDTVHAGVVGQFATNPTAFGDYAVITGHPGSLPGQPAEETGGLSPMVLIVGGGLTVVVILVIAAGIAMRRRRTPAPVPSQARGIPSKRKRPPKPPSPPTRPPGGTER